MNRAMTYIEENLTGHISYDKAARLACCSTYHFQRMFSFVCGVSLSEYIRRRRLNFAAIDMQTIDDKVTDIASRYGYESPEAFSRAFKALYGIAPIAMRESCLSFKPYTPITFQRPVTGDYELKCRILQREAFEVFGKYTEVSTIQAEAFEQVPRFFKECDENGVTESINAVLGRFSDNYTLSCLYDHTETTFKYMLCQYKPNGIAIPEYFTTLAIPAATWAVFDVPDMEMQKIWVRIWNEWFPASEYEISQDIHFEMYYGLARHENSFGEIWVPVTIK